MKKIEILPTLLCGFDYLNAASFKRTFDSCYEKYGNIDETGNFVTGETEGYNLVHHEEKFNHFYKFIYDCCEKYIIELGIDLDRFDIYLAKSWLSFSDNEMIVLEHSHADHHISFIYYVDAPKDCYHICFKNPISINLNEPFHMAFHNSNIKTKNQYNVSVYNIPPKEGSVLFFPSKLIHFTDGEKFEGTRRAIAGDFMMVYKDIGNKMPWGLYDQKYWRKF